MCTELGDSWILDPVSFRYYFMPHTTCCPYFGNFFEEVIVHRYVERETSDELFQGNPVPPFRFIDQCNGFCHKQA
jgi:hypothetical protein